MPPLRALTPTAAQQPLDERRARRFETDRFIPSRYATDLGVSAFEVEQGGSSTGEGEANASPAKEEYKKRLAAELFRGGPANNRVLNFGLRSTNELPNERPAASGDDSLRMLYTLNRQAVRRVSWTGRVIPQSPERILDAPELLDDYYLNLLDWNDANILGITPLASTRL